MNRFHSRAILDQCILSSIGAAPLLLLMALRWCLSLGARPSIVDLLVEGSGEEECGRGEIDGGARFNGAGGGAM